MGRRQRLIRAGILLAVFCVAVLIFSAFTNQDTENLTADMGSATFPQVSFSYNGYSLNALPGYAQEMDIPSMRDTISPVVEDEVDLELAAYDQVITGLDYKVYSMDGTEVRCEGEVEDPEDKVTLTFPEGQDFSEEQVLMLTLNVQDIGPVYYYTRIVDAADKNLLSCLDYVYYFHNSALAKDQDSGIASSLETNDEGDDSNYNHIDIHSTFNHVSWGNLNPQVNGNVRWEITEMNSVYTSVRLEYLVDCAGEENETDEYKVKEFFRVRYHTIYRKMYLLDYDRRMEQVVNASQTVIGESGVNLGISDTDVQYLANQAGTIVSFVQADELWVYNAEKNVISEVFSFVPAEGADARDLLSDHRIRLLEMDEEGNTTFAVLGYMNRGVHEGEVGAAVYYYDRAENAVTEKVFVPTDRSWGYAVYEMGEMLYYSSDLDSLYMMVDGTLYEYHVETLWTKTLREDLPDVLNVVSDNGSRVAYRTPEEDGQTTKITVKDFVTGEEMEVAGEAGDIIVPLGFVDTDFVYGSQREEDAGETEAGEEVTPYYRLDIKNVDGETVKTYQEEGIYILDVTMEDNVITLVRATRNEEGIYVETTEEYIMSNEEPEEQAITKQNYVTDLKNTQVRLAFADGIQSREPRISNPQLILDEEPQTVEFTDNGNREKYYVYGYGEPQGIMSQAGEAVMLADAYSGVVISDTQAYVWQRGYRDLTYETENSQVVDQICEGLRNGETPLQIMEGLGEGAVLDLTGCTTDEVLYVVNQGYPVIAMTEEKKGVVIVGYDTETVTYADAGSGKQSTVSYEAMDAMVEGSGRTFVGKMNIR